MGLFNNITLSVDSGNKYLKFVFGEFKIYLITERI